MSDRFFFISPLAVVSWPHELFSKNWQCLPPIRRNGSNGETGVFCVHRKGKWYGRIDSELVNPLLGRGGAKRWGGGPEVNGDTELTSFNGEWVGVRSLTRTVLAVAVYLYFMLFLETCELKYLKWWWWWKSRRIASSLFHNVLCLCPTFCNLLRIGNRFLDCRWNTCPSLSLSLSSIFLCWFLFVQFWGSLT